MTEEQVRDELVSYEEVEKIEEEAGLEKKKKKRGRRIDDEEAPLSLQKLSGEETVRILDFLHRRYLSWMTEAEGTKYAGLYRTAKEEALREALETYSEIQKQNQQLLERMEKLIQTLEAKLTTAPAQEIAQQTAEQIKRSILDDPRVRSLLFIGLESLFGNNPQYQKYRNFLLSLLFPEAMTPKEGESSD